MRSVTLSHLFLLSIGLNRPFSVVASSCRCLFGQPCWPSQDEFDQLASQISQRLVHPVPPASPCYSSPGSLECATVIQGWSDGNWRSDQPGAMQEPNFETYTFPNGTIEACYLNTTLGVPCGRGSVSAIGVDVRSPIDVQAAVNFSAKHNLRLVVKNTGHDYFGRSDGRGSFMIWTHNMKNIAVIPSFRPAGAPPTETYEYAMTLEAGVQWHEAYSAANAANRMLVGGASAGGSVGAAGGWLQGGGHSALSPSYGLGVDNVLEITVVTSTGALLTTNAHQHPDLFWALRGGGGGTFGVVTTVTYRTRPSTPVVAAFLSASIATSAPNVALTAAFAELVRITPKLTDAGWGAYVSILATPTGGLSFTMLGMVPNVSWAQANATMQPYLAHVQELATNASAAGTNATMTVDAALTEPFQSWYAWYSDLFTNGTEVGLNFELGSWLLPRDTIESDPEEIARTLLSIPGGLGYYLVAGGAVSKVPTSSAGINPAWRAAAVHVVTGTSWPEGASSGTIAQLSALLEVETAKLRALAPQSGAYFNEASLFEPDPAQAFFGAHYAPLRAVKALYDPVDLFVVTEGVGSAEWDKQLTCRV